jgi:Zn-dependent M32 family carboxypeptidase
MLFGNPQKKTHKVHMNEGQSKYFENMVIRHKEFEKKNQFQKDF